jgi:hypothetical protein
MVGGPGSSFRFAGSRAVASTVLQTHSFGNRTTDDRWTWGGTYFGYREGDDLLTHTGQHVGRFRGDEVYGPDGRYLGEVMSDNRLITNNAKSSQRGSGFAPCGRRAPRVPYVNYVGYVMYVLHQDFPLASSRDAQRRKSAAIRKHGREHQRGGRRKRHLKQGECTKIMFTRQGPRSWRGAMPLGSRQADRPIGRRTSALGDDNFEIFARHRHRAIVRAIEFVGQCENIAGQRHLRVRIECREGLKHRPVERLEHIEPMLR